MADRPYKQVSWSLAEPKAQDRERLLREVQTERKRAEEALRESEERFRVLADNIPQLAWMADGKGWIFWYNKRWYDYTGTTLEEMQGWGWKKVHHPEHVDRVVERIALSWETGQPWEDTFPLRGKDGAYRWFLSRALPIHDAAGRLVRWFGTNTDITAQRAAEEALRRSEERLRELNATLEQRVSERTAELRRRAAQLQTMASQLTQAEQRERRRLAEILHDHLQQLLVAGKLQLSVLSNQLGDPEARRDLETVTDLLNQSIETSRTLTVELSPPILYESGLVAALEWLTRWMLEKYGLTVHLEVEQPVDLEDEDLRVLVFQSVRELLFNTVKHAGVQEAWVHLRQVDETHLQVTVADRGKGFDAQRAHQQQEKKAGFGLFSVHERLELMGGEMTVQSQPGQGTRVTLRVPLKRRVPG